MWTVRCGRARYSRSSTLFGQCPTPIVPGSICNAIPSRSSTGLDLTVRCSSAQNAQSNTRQHNGFRAVHRRSVACSNRRDAGTVRSGRCRRHSGPARANRRDRWRGLLASHPTAATLVELLEARRDDNSGYVAVGLDGDTRTMSFGELCTASLSGAQALQRKDRLRHGAVRTPAVITVSDPLAFIVAFFAVMQAGMVAIAAPDSPEEHPAHRRR